VWLWTDTARFSPPSTVLAYSFFRYLDIQCRECRSGSLHVWFFGFHLGLILISVDWAHFVLPGGGRFYEMDGLLRPVFGAPPLSSPSSPFPSPFFPTFGPRRGVDWLEIRPRD